MGLNLFLKQKHGRCVFPLWRTITSTSTEYNISRDARQNTKNYITQPRPYIKAHITGPLQGIYNNNNNNNNNNYNIITDLERTEAGATIVIVYIVVAGIDSPLIMFVRNHLITLISDFNLDNMVNTYHHIFQFI